MGWISAEALFGIDDENEESLDDFPARPLLVLKAPTHLHDNHGAIWRPKSENAATFGPMPASAKLKAETSPALRG